MPDDSTTPPNQTPAANPLPQPPQAVSNQPVTQPPLAGKKNKLTKILAAVIAGVVVLGGSAAAYFGVVVPNQPDNVFKTALSNSLKEHQVKSDGKFSIDDPNAKSSELKAVDINFTGQSDTDKKAFVVAIEAAASGIKLPMELRVIDGNIYFKFGDLTSLSNLVKTAAPNYATLFNQLATAVSNKWIEFDNTLLKQSGTDCLANFPAFNDIDVKVISEDYSKNQFAVIKSHSSDSVNGRAAIRFGLTIDKTKVKSFSDSLSNVPSLKDFKSCTDKYAKNSMLSSEANKNSEQLNYDLTVWVDKATKTFSKLELKITGKDGTQTLTENIQYGGVNVSKPDGATPFMDFFNQLAPSLETTYPTSQL